MIKFHPKSSFSDIQNPLKTVVIKNYVYLNIKKQLTRTDESKLRIEIKENIS